METPLVSILIPFRNTAEYLIECLDSIRGQTYPHWEVLAINDHSNDGSREILGHYCRKDDRIKLWDNQGHGIIEALRLAFSKSAGDFITRMDSDDIMLPEKLESMVGSLKANGKGHLAVTQVRYFSHRGISDGYERYEKWLNGLTAGASNYSEIYKECVIPSPAWMIHRADLEACGAFRPCRYPEDYDLAFRFYEIGIRCLPCDTVLHLWRDYDSRTSRTSEHYAQNYFLDIKLHYFLKLDHDPNRPLTVWGAGTKGKEIAKGLLRNKIPFEWLCDNPKKIGKSIYEKKMLHYTALAELSNPQSIITVANTSAQRQIRAYLSQLDQRSMADFFFFC